MIKHLKRDQNGQLVLCVAPDDLSKRGNLYIAEVYLVEDHFDLELFRINDDETRTRMNVSYWNDNIKNATAKAIAWLNYHVRSY